MPAEVITAALSLVGTLVGTLGGIALSSNLTNYRIEQLEKKVEKHNNLITRTYKLEQEFAVMDEKVKVANHRIDDLEDLEHESYYSGTLSQSVVLGRRCIGCDYGDWC